jgi:hypothetical protein
MPKKFGACVVARIKRENVDMVTTLARELSSHGDSDETDAMMKIAFQNANAERADDAAQACSAEQQGRTFPSFLPRLRAD